MEPVTLHFNIFQAGSPLRKTLQVEDPKGTTIFGLKQQLFSDELKECKSVRFIAGGKILEDKEKLHSFKLGNEAHIHVSVSDGSGVRSRAQSDASNTTAAEAKSYDACSEEPSESAVSWAFILGAVIFIGTGAMLFAALRKRYQFSMNTSQLLFICAAIWVYLLLFHGLPAAFQTLSKIGNAPRTPVKELSSQSVMAAGVVVGTGALDEVPSVSSTASPATAAASPGLSLMTPTLPPGDAVAAASVLTQRH